METSPAPEASASPAPRRHGRRARQLTPEELAELERLRAEYEATHGPIDDQKPSTDDAAEEQAPQEPVAAEDAAPTDGAPVDEPVTEQIEPVEPVEDVAADEAGEQAESDAPVSDDEASASVDPIDEAAMDDATVAVEPEAADPSDGPAPLIEDAPVADVDEPREHDPWAVPEEPAVPTLRKFGRRARIIEVDEDPTAAAEASASTAIPTDADGVELGELSVGEAPAPKPAPRFEGRVLNRSGGSSTGSPVMWIVWALVALAVISLVVLLATGVLGGGSASALVPAGEGISLAAPASTPTLEVPLS